MRHLTFALFVFTLSPSFGISKTISPDLLPRTLQQEGRYRLMFVTSSTRDGLSSDIEDYNNFVQAVADASELTGPLGLEWKALVSTEAVDARDNIEASLDIHELAPIYLMNGSSAISGGRGPEYLFNDLGETFVGPVNITEDGTRLPPDPPPFTDFGGRVVHTGTSDFGTALRAGALGGPPNSGFAGDAYLNGHGAYSWMSYDLSAQAHFYAVSEVFSVPETISHPCDFNENGVVDFADFLLLSNAFGKSAEDAGFEFDKDGSRTVDFADFVLFTSDFGVEVGAQPVPEPSFGIQVLLLAVVTFYLVRRRAGLDT